MKRRKNAIYKGQSKRASTGTGDRALAYNFYSVLNRQLLPEDEVEIIPPTQVNPTHDRQHQILIMANYCVRKILPEVTSLFHCGDEVTPQLRALAPIVDRETADAAYDAADDATAAYRDGRDAAFRGARDAVAVYVSPHDADAVGSNAAAYASHEAAVDVAFAAREAAREARDAVFATYDAAVDAAEWDDGVGGSTARFAAEVAYRALMVCALADDEATYNRIIDLTNEMLESL